MCGGNGGFQPGGPGMTERNSVTPFNPATMDQVQYGSPGNPQGPAYMKNAPMGGQQFDFAAFMRNPQAQQMIQSMMQRKMGGGMYAGGSPNFRENNPLAQPTGNAPFPMRQQPQPRPNLPLVPPGTGSGGLLGARPMTPVMPPAGLPPGVSVGFQPGQLATRNRGLY